MNGASAPQRRLYCYPWDVQDSAPTPPRVIFPEDGVLYFEPELARYGALRPQPHSDAALQRVLPALVAGGRRPTGGQVLARASNICALVFMRILH